MMNCSARYRCNGFSLIETVVAAVILSGAVVAICAISTQSFRGVQLNRQHEIAWGLLDEKLTMIDAVGIEEFLEEGETEGAFDEMADGPVYQWVVSAEQQESDWLYAVRIVVLWQHGSKLEKVSLMTMLNGTGAYAEDAEGGSQGQGQGQS